VACACLGAYAVFGHDGLLAYQQKQHQSHRLQQQILRLKQENQRLALHDQRLQSDPDTLEYEAREQMHYTRPGEVIYTLPEAPGAAKHK
jgi:cell division protein FtsB